MLLENARIGTPCDADWDAMAGDERVRFCDACGKNVYNLSALPRAEAERLLVERGCPKLNLQVRSSNAEVIEFYRRLGYVQDDVVSLGRRLIHDQAPGKDDDRTGSSLPGRP
jgi:hypothetical protein